MADDQDIYPEVKPNRDEGLPSKFLFDPTVAPETRIEIDAGINALEERIENIVRRASVNGMNLVMPILKMISDPDDVEMMGKAFTRLAPLLRDLDNLRARQSVFNLLESDPSFFPASFGDFSDELAEVVGESGFSDKHVTSSPIVDSTVAQPEARPGSAKKNSEL